MYNYYIGSFSTGACMTHVFFLLLLFSPLKCQVLFCWVLFSGVGWWECFFFFFFNPDGKPGVSDDSAGVTYSDSPFQSHLLLFFPSA